MSGVREALGRVDAAVRKALAGAVDALRRVPRWAAIVVAIVAIAVVGESTFLIMQSGGEEAAKPVATEKPLPCDEREAAEAVRSDRFAKQVRTIGTVPPLAKVLDVYDVHVLGCVDLTGDGVDEMVLQLTQSGIAPATAGGTAAPWAVYQPIDGRWTPVAIRTATGAAKVTVEKDQVREVSSALVEGDPLCCASGRREGVLRWNGKEFTYRPLGGPRGRTIAVGHGEAEAIAGFPLQEGSLADAVKLFGPPSTYGPTGEVCPAEWDDLGIRIDFANLGGLDPCGVDGRVADVTVQGPEARQAGWMTQEGAMVEITEKQLRRRYPDMAPAPKETVFSQEAPEGRLFTLVHAPSEVGADGVTPVLSARVSAGRVVGFEVQVGAAGE